MINYNTNYEKSEMYVLIAIIFISEFIIAFSLLSKIVSADRVVKSLDEKSAVLTPVLLDSVRISRKSISLVRSSILKSVEIFNYKRSAFRQKVIHLIVIYIILLILKTKFKKAATLCQYAVFLKDCWDLIIC